MCFGNRQAYLWNLNLSFKNVSRWAENVTAVRFSFFICEVQIITPTSQSCQNKLDRLFKAPNKSDKLLKCLFLCFNLLLYPCPFFSHINAQQNKFNCTSLLIISYNFRSLCLGSRHLLTGNTKTTLASVSRASWEVFM